MSIYARGLARAYARGRAQRDANIAKPVANFHKEQCRCGLPKHSKHLVCLCCWKATPYQVRRELEHADLEIRRRAVRKILEVAQGRAGAAQSSPDAHTAVEDNRATNL